jgi:serine/threonine-protein kinase
VLAGKYRVERVLGAGGMGIVVCAHHLQLDERVAIKFLRPEALDNADAVARFDREARAAVKIKSEHVARIIDVGRLETGQPYMVMEYLEGRDLSAWLKERGALPVEQAVEFVLQACEAIAEAHAIGIVHRDLKPANLFCVVRSDGLHAVKVLDFGISKLTGLSASGSDMAMTRTQALMGSPFYMSPEQMQSTKNVDARADIWALGVILYQLVTGRVPFAGEMLPELVLNIVNTPVPPLRALRPDAPPVLDQIVGRCLQKDRANRYSNVAELAQALAPLAPRRAASSVDRITRVIQNASLGSSGPMAVPPVSGSPPPPNGTTNGPTAVVTMASWGQTASGSGRKKALLGVSLAVVVTGMALAGGVLLLKRSSPSAGSVPEPASASVATSASVLTFEPAPASASAPPQLASPPPTSVPAVASTESPPPAARPAPRPAVAATLMKVPPAAKPVCSAVPYLDSEGNTHFKQVCK